MTEIKKRIITALALALGFSSLLFYAPPWIFSLVIVGITILVIGTEWSLLFDYRKATFWLLMPAYPLLPLALLIALRFQGYKTLILLSVSIVAAHDMGSYFIGKRWGKHKIAPSISPGKTWEGFLGGCACTLLVTVLFFSHQKTYTLFSFVLPFALLVSTLALLGDLFESYLKRRVSLKDSGNLLPGHGGILDRIDSLLFVIPLIYALRFYLQALA
jgi:phosphatidate cytidylyltransferase